MELMYACDLGTVTTHYRVVTVLAHTQITGLQHTSLTCTPGDCLTHADYQWRKDLSFLFSHDVHFFHLILQASWIHAFTSPSAAEQATSILSFCMSKSCRPWPLVMVHHVLCAFSSTAVHPGATLYQAGKDLLTTVSVRHACHTASPMYCKTGHLLD